MISEFKEKDLFFDNTNSQQKDSHSILFGNNAINQYKTPFYNNKRNNMNPR